MTATFSLAKVLDFEWYRARVVEVLLVLQAEFEGRSFEYVLSV